ncbi:TIGR04104 family putative zinc finger protein [Jeotgalibacillus sp. R-1-5s-1]|uniref:TIGR04104 family putative zinc finger protein n=1 Tax=Jeotgalibacillus sp. R-1-5s-1 TaxID=2555897 RepID=UPI0010693E05|nr:TIGR04104 family putative zinc finger protein [Jeotgalibacillus sp. R-1-5s-1]TFD92933.1 hypothetical protein E2491_15350 [Jeotgalibacillus sp. R-1-5s-1]
MPRCQNCHQKWSHLATLKRSLNFSSGVTCPHCGEKQFVTKQSRKRSASLSGLISFIIIAAALFFNFSLSELLIFSGVILVLSMLILPYGIELTNKDEPYW